MNTLMFLIIIMIIQAVLGLIVLAVCKFKLDRWSKKTPRPEASPEETEVLEEKFLDPTSFHRDELNKNFFRSDSFIDLACLIEFHSKNKDLAIFSTSLPHHFRPLFDFEIKRKFLKSVLQIESFSSDSQFATTHSIGIFKSPAAKWSDIEVKIMEFLFTHLYQVHGWRYEKQTMDIESISENIIRLRFNTPIEYLPDLELDLIAFTTIPLMKVDGKIPFVLDKVGDEWVDVVIDIGFSWDYVLSKLNLWANDYFPKGAEFQDFREEVTQNK